MTSSKKDFVLERIRIFAGKEIDPNEDAQVVSMLREKFNIRLPQRNHLSDSLSSVASDHEIIALLLQYRSMK